MGVRALASKYGVNCSIVWSHARRSGMRSRRRELHPQESVAAAALYGGGLTLDQVGERFGVGSAAAHAAILAEGGQICVRGRYWPNG